MESDWSWRQLFVFSFAALVCGQREAGCDPGFRASVESCMQNLHGFPVFTRHKTLLVGDWARTYVICKWQLVRGASLCLSTVYAMCPQTKAFRSLCGFQSLDPDLLLHYGDVICQHKDVLREHAVCLNSSLCSLKACLKNFDPIIPSRLSTGMWKSPQNSQQCLFHAYAEHCHEKTLLLRCPLALYEALVDILNVTRPYTCDGHQMDRLRRSYRGSGTSVVLSCACDWLLRPASHVLIGALSVVLAANPPRVFDIG